VHRRRALLPLSAALSIGLVSTGCDFFKELQSDPDAGEGTDGGETASSETGTDGSDATAETGDAGPCDVLDETCSDQDTLNSCNFESGELVTYNCAVVCGSELLNFTCTPTDSFIHACWCVSPGAIKQRTCYNLEDCIADCGDPESDCASNCFGDTDSQTVRLLGSLYSCADRACDSLCASTPEQCSDCLGAARAGLWGDCSVERSVCDADELDQPWP